MKTFEELINNHTFIGTSNGILTDTDSIKKLMKKVHDQAVDLCIKNVTIKGNCWKGEMKDPEVFDDRMDVWVQYTSLFIVKDMLK